MRTFHDFEATPTWAPLEHIAELVGQQPRIPAPDVGSYMWMGAVVDADRSVTVQLYKHVDTRRYLNVDDAGHAYRYAGAADDEFTELFYEPLDLAFAIDWAQREVDRVPGSTAVGEGEGRRSPVRSATTGRTSPSPRPRRVRRPRPSTA